VEGEPMTPRGRRHRPNRLPGLKKRRSLTAPDSAPLADGGIERLLRLVGAFTLALYVVGLIAVNGYLFQLDVSDFALVRARFIYTGALLATLGVLPYLVLKSATARFSEARSRTLPNASHKGWRSRLGRWDAMLRPIGELLVIPMMLIALVATMNDYKGSESLQAVAAVLPAYVVGLILCAATERHLRMLLRRQEVEKIPLLHHTYLGYTAFLLLYFIGIYIAVFMAFSYTRIPEQFGGGRPSDIWLLIKEDAIQGAKEIGIPIPQGSNLTGKLQLMYEGSEAYVLRLPPDRIVRINKDMVSGAITKQ